MTDTFLCTHCQAVMCDDCRQIAEEYQELYDRQKRELADLLHKVGEWQIKYQNAERRAQLYEEVAKAGIPQIVEAWLEQEIVQLLSAGEKVSVAACGEYHQGPFIRDPAGRARCVACKRELDADQMGEASKPETDAYAA